MPSPERSGGAAQRTVLARQRLALSYGGLGALFLGVAAHRELRWPLVVSAALLVVAAVVWRALPRPALTAACTAVAAVCAIATVLG
jgi:hypothetical protein